MDALALLCTLHADGPTTLRRLRDAGCGSLEDLGHVTAERLAELIGVSPAAGRRFLREAGTLAERLGRQDLEPEEAAAPAAAPAASTPDHTVLAPAPPASSRGLDRTDRQVLERVIDRWRAEEALEEANRTEFSAEDRSDRLAGLRAESRISPSERPLNDLPDEPVPATTTGNGLRPRALDGLDADTCAKLTAAGCETLESLAADSALDLARRSGLPFTLVRRLQFHAARAVPTIPAAPAAPLPTPESSTVRHAASFAAAPGTDRAGDDGPAGPFA